MRRFVPAIAFATLFVFMGFQAAQLFAGSGESVFNTLRCNSCHKPDKKATGASFSEISKAYGGDQEKLIQFFKGGSKAIIETERPGMMRGQMSKLEALADEDRKALAEYVLSFK